MILFADDDKTCLDVSVQILQRLRYAVLEERDGKEAVEVYKNYKDRVVLVILDMRYAGFLKKPFGLKALFAEIKNDMGS